MIKPFQTIKHPLELAEFVYRVCPALGASVTSWGRSVQHNAYVGGSETSQHQIWAAIDVVFDNFDRDAMCFQRLALAHDLWVQPLTQTRDKGYVHIQIKRVHLNAGEYV